MLLSTNYVNLRGSFYDFFILPLRRNVPCDSDTLSLPTLNVFWLKPLPYLIHPLLRAMLDISSLLVMSPGPEIRSLRRRQQQPDTSPAGKLILDLQNPFSAQVCTLLLPLLNPQLTLCPVARSKFDMVRTRDFSWHDARYYPPVLTPTTS